MDTGSNGQSGWDRWQWTLQVKMDNVARFRTDRWQWTWRLHFTQTLRNWAQRKIQYNIIYCLYAIEYWSAKEQKSQYYGINHVIFLHTLLNCRSKLQLYQSSLYFCIVKKCQQLKLNVNHQKLSRRTSWYTMYMKKPLEQSNYDSNNAFTKMNGKLGWQRIN